MKIPQGYKSTLVFGALAALLMQTGAAAESSKPARPLDAVGAILDAFVTHQLVALGEDHGNEQTQALRLSLIRDPRFADSVDDIVVEFGNAHYQTVIDQYVSGQEVSQEKLAKVWQDTGVTHGVWDVPIYEEIYGAVRSINQKLPVHRRLRVLLGDPPLDWATVCSKEDLAKWSSGRDTYPAQIIEKEVLKKSRKALILYGAWHTTHQSHISRDGLSRIAPLLALVEASTGAKAFSIDLSTNVLEGLDLIDRVALTWPAPSLVMLKGTTLGAHIRQGELYPLEKQYDAMIYLGPRAAMTQSKLALDLVTDPNYLQLRMERAALPSVCATQVR